MVYSGVDGKERSLKVEVHGKVTSENLAERYKVSDGPVLFQNSYNTETQKNWLGNPTPAQKRATALLKIADGLVNPSAKKYMDAYINTFYEGVGEPFVTKEEKYGLTEVADVRFVTPFVVTKDAEGKPRVFSGRNGATAEQYRAKISFYDIDKEETKTRPVDVFGEGEKKNYERYLQEGTELEVPLILKFQKNPVGDKVYENFKGVTTKQFQNLYCKKTCSLFDKNKEGNITPEALEKIKDNLKKTDLHTAPPKNGKTNKKLLDVFITGYENANKKKEMKTVDEVPVEVGDDKANEVFPKYDNKAGYLRKVEVPKTKDTSNPTM